MSRSRVERVDRFLVRRRRPMGWALFAIVLAALFATLDDPGITWDEPAYFGSAQLQVRWVKTLLSEGPSAALDRETVYELWDWDHYHNPHPPLYKEGMALTWWAARGLLGPLAAFRLFPAILFAGVILVLFRWGCSAWSGLGGLGAAVSTAAMPRLLGHAHLGATETPLIFGWVAGTAAVWWAVERDRRAGWIAAGLAWGLAMGTKFTGVAALGPALAWALWRDPKAAVRRAPLAGLVAVLVFVALNPMIWVDARSFLGTWLWESTHRGEYAAFTEFYLGVKRPFDAMPWHHVFVMTAATLPLGILVAALSGGWMGVRRRDPLALLAAGSVAFVWGFMLLPASPHHNGVRQFIVLFPFLGLLAGYAAHALRDRLSDGRMAWVAGLVFLPAFVQVVQTHPHHLAYYGEAVGGVRGAHTLGLETTYWMEVVTEDALEWMNENVPEEATVHVIGPTIPLVLAQGLGRLRRDIRFTEELPADYMLVPSMRNMMVPELRRALDEVRPAFEIELHGVRLLGIYQIGGDPP